MPDVHPAIVNAREVNAYYDRRWRVAWVYRIINAGIILEREQAKRMSKAIRLAPTLDLFYALMRDEPVPISSLNQEWVARYGMRE